MPADAAPTEPNSWQFPVPALSVLATGTSLWAADRIGLPFRCAFHATFGLWCPGCGGTRAALALARFDIPAALDAHPLVVAAAPAVIALTASTRLRRWTGSFFVRRPAVLFAPLVLFAVARNLPLDAASLLAPP